MPVDPSSVRQVVVKPAQRAEEFVRRQHQEAVRTYQSQWGLRPGEPWLIVQSDGLMLRTGQLQPEPAGGLSPKRQRPRRRRQTRWREVRLSTVQQPQEAARLYGAVLDSPPKPGEPRFYRGSPGHCWLAGEMGLRFMG